MHAYSINVKQTMRHSRVESDIAHGVRLGGVGFWQEIAPKKAKASLARNAARAGIRVLGISKECPVTLRPGIWAVEQVREHYMHKGRMLVTPSRWVVEVRTHRTNQPKLKVAFFGTHFISAAWSRNHMSTRKWRRKMWFIHYARLRNLVADAHRDGYTCIIGMDANKGIESLNLHRDQKIVVANRIDGIIVVPAEGIRVGAGNKDVHRGLFTDHDPVSIELNLVRRAA